MPRHTHRHRHSQRQQLKHQTRNGYFFWFHLIPSLRGIFQLAAGEKFAVNTLLEKYVANGYWGAAQARTPNKLGAKLPVIGFYARCLLEQAEEGE